MMNSSRRTTPVSLLSLICPSKELFHQQQALLHRTLPGHGSAATSPAQRSLMLDEPLIKQKRTTFFMRVAGNSMHGLGICDGDLLLVDRAMRADHGCIVIAAIDGEFSVKQLLCTQQGRILRAAHPDHPDVHISTEQEFFIWGVVQWSTKIHRPTAQ